MITVVADDLEQRLAVVKIGLRAFADFLKPGRRIVQGLPADAVIVGCRYDETDHTMRLTVRSCTFPLVGDFEVLRVLPYDTVVATSE